MRQDRFETIIRDNKKSTIQRNWQHLEHKTKINQTKANTQYVLDTIMLKQAQIT
jgi:hypothetical protein